MKHWLRRISLSSELVLVVKGPLNHRKGGLEEPKQQKIGKGGRKRKKERRGSNVFGGGRRADERSGEGRRGEKKNPG